MTIKASIVALAPVYTKQVANLHIDNIGTGFISSLGPVFVSELYKAIASCPFAFSYAALVEKNVVGFIACTTNVGSLYKSILMKRGWRLAFPLLRFVLKPRTIKKIIQTLLYPSQMVDQYPPAEILSVAVHKQFRKQGIASSLMKAALKEFQQHKCNAVKVIVGADNVPANRYYIKEGFHLAGTLESHGIPTNVYVQKLKDN